MIIKGAIDCRSPNATDPQQRLRLNDGTRDVPNGQIIATIISVASRAAVDWALSPLTRGDVTHILVFARETAAVSNTDCDTTDD